MARAPFATWRPVPGPTDPKIRPIGVILHVDAGNAYSLYNWWLSPASQGIESHFHIAKDGHCLTPNHKVLTEGLRWVPIGDVAQGDRLVGFDERGPRRRYQPAEVEAVTWAKEPVYAVVLDTEETIYTTAEHRWLVQSHERWGWRQTINPSGVSLVGANVPRLFEPWRESNDFEAGWFAGILDGEGTLTARHRLSFSQRPGPVLDRALSFLDKRNITYTVSQVKDGSDCLHIDLTGPLPDRLATLGQLQPSRLVPKVNPELFGQVNRSGSRSAHKVVAVYPVGERDIVKVQTSARTFIADGFPMHNCEQYRDTEQEADANYKGNSFIRNGERVGYISVETQGYADGTWTPAQIDRIKQLLTWASSEHDFPLVVCPSPYDPGVGYHVMWGAPGDWTPTSKTCPGPNRIDQFRNIIVPWMEDHMQKIPMPDFVKSDINYLKTRGYFPAGVPAEETYDMWRTYAFLARADRSLWNRAVEWTRNHVKTSIAAALATGAGAGQVDYGELVRRIGEILAGG